MSQINDALKRAGETPQPPALPAGIPSLPKGTVVFRELPEPKPSQLPMLIFGAVLVLIVGLAAFFLVRGMVRKQASGWRDSMQKVHARQVSEPATAAPSEPAPDHPASTQPAQPQPKVAPRLEGAPAPVHVPAVATNAAAGSAAPAPVLMGTNGFPLLKVQGIFFRTKNPAAVINAKTVFIGDQVSNAKVVAITTDSVTVEFNGNRKVLTLY